jgi:hypothetical protein
MEESLQLKTVRQLNLQNHFTNSPQKWKHKSEMTGKMLVKQMETYL